MPPSIRESFYSPCVSLGRRELASTARLQHAAWYAGQASWVELRFDLLQRDGRQCVEGIEEMVRMFARFEHRIAVCHRSADGLNAEQRMGVIGRAVAAGCNAVDIDWQEERDYPSALYSALARRGVKRVRSCHLSNPLSSPKALRGLIARMRHDAPFLVKVVMPCYSQSQMRMVLSCYDGKSDLLLIAAGQAGRTSRVVATRHGAPFSYVHLGSPTGPGQISLAQYRKAFRNGL